MLPMFMQSLRILIALAFCCWFVVGCSSKLKTTTSSGQIPGDDTSIGIEQLDTIPSPEPGTSPQIDPRYSPTASPSPTSSAGSPPVTGSSEIVPDKNPPTALLAFSVASITNANPFPVSLTFSEVITGFSADDITVTNGNVSNLQGISTQYSFDVVPISNGPISIWIAAERFMDANGNSNIASNQLSTTYDGTRPSLTITSNAGSLVNAAFNVTFTFSESVQNFVSSDLSLQNATVIGFTGSGTTYNAMIQPTTQGAVTVDAAANIATDSAGNDNLAASSAFATTFDSNIPSVTLSTAAASPTRTSTYAITATFSETVSGVDLTDLAISNGSASNLSGSGTTYSFDVAATAHGAVTIRFKAGGAQDVANNGNSASNEITIEYDIQGPLAPTIGASYDDRAITIAISPGAGGDTSGYCVIQSYGVPVDFTPTNGATSTGAVRVPLAPSYRQSTAYCGTATSISIYGMPWGDTVHFAVFARDSLYNYSAAATTSVTLPPAAMLYGVPSFTTTDSNLNVKIGGYRLHEYKHAVVNYLQDCETATYSSWTPAATAIIDSTGSGGLTKLCVIGRNATGTEQLRPSEYVYKLTKNISIKRPHLYGNRAEIGDNFLLMWDDHDASDDASGTVSFYYAPSLGANCTSGLPIQTNIAQNTTTKAINWSTSGATAGSYYICAEVYDGVATTYVWSAGKVELVTPYCVGAATTNSLLSNGTGSSSDPYVVCNLSQLNEIRSISASSKYVEIRKDIDAATTSTWNAGEGWIPHATASATQIIGNGHLIKGLTINRPASTSQALFSTLTDASSVQHLDFVDVNITGNGNTATIAVSGGGSSLASATIEKIIIHSGTISGSSGTKVGAIIATSPSGNAGVNKRSVMHSAVFANISGGSIVGGIAGSVNEFTNSGVKNSYFEGTLTGSSSVGGIAGEGGIVEASFAAPQFTNGGTGIIGATKSASTAYSYASGFYVNNANAHGVGANYIEQTYGTGSVNFGWNAGATAYTFHSWYKGDLAARLMNTLGPNNSGGIVMDSWWEGVDTTDEGTLARSCYSGFVQRVSLKGSVTAIHSGGSYWGGMCEVQQQTATVFRDTYIDIALTSGATGAWRPGMYVGRKVSGVVVIANSYSTGSINVAQGSGLSRIGDILENVFSTVTFPGTAWSIQAAFPSNATNVYGYIPAVAGPTACYQTTAGGSCATQTNTAYFQNAANAPMTSWDFTDTWEIPSGVGYPVFKGQSP